MNENPLVSVVIPSYNREQFVLEAVRSVLGQSYTNYEILVADDGSTDGTVPALRDLDGPLRVIELAHSGQGAIPRNRAIQESRGDLIAFLDDDDLWLKDKLERQVALFLAEPRVSLVYCDAFFLYPDGEMSDPVLKPAQKETGRLFEGLINTCYLHPSTVILRRILFERIGLFEERFTTQSNYLFWLRAAHREPAGFVDQPLALVRRHPGSRQNRHKHDQFDHLILIFTHFYRTERLLPKARFLVRRTISRAHTHIGLSLLSLDERAQARRRFLLALAWNPIQRRAWMALINNR